MISDIFVWKENYLKMDKKSVSWLNNVPYVGKNADQELANTIAATPHFITLSAKEKQRLDYEMI